MNSLLRMNIINKSLFSSSRPKCFQLKAAPACLCRFSSKPIDEENQPVRFSTSEAADRGRLVNKVETLKPRYERSIIIASIATFMIYFFYLREENDLDGELKASLFDRLPAMEKIQIENAIDFNKQHGKDFSELQARLDEIQSKN